MGPDNMGNGRQSYNKTSAEQQNREFRINWRQRCPKLDTVTCKKINITVTNEAIITECSTPTIYS